MRFDIAHCVALTLVSTALGGCGSDAKPPVVTGPPSNADRLNATPDTVTPSPNASIPKSRGNVSIEESIVRACNIGDADAYFAFDSAAVDARARTVLGKVADCFEKGPLRGKRMRLIGHADPRGDSEYNMVLAGERASSVEQVLVGEGLSSQRVSTSSRGEMDATGTDEASWARDRRVDVTLGG
jgi:peptidoglycan-associated lipoprotein